MPDDAVASQLLVNNVVVDNADVETDRGVVHGVARVLHVLHNRCDTNETTVTLSKCSSCQFKPDCPVGTVPVEGPGPRRKSNCIYLRYFLGRRQMFLGCRSNCARTVITTDCCEGFFGPPCAACPGQVEAAGEGGGACGGHGICSDGLNGTGACACQEGYTGRACQQCEPGKFGHSCLQDCACVNGRCRDGEQGDGSCGCAVGWRGIRCDERIKDDLCNKTCHSSANCVAGAAVGGVPSCVCAAGFTGNGSDCTAVNACERDNGGCSVFASCTRTQPGLRICTCMQGFTGDGVICEEIDPCLENNGGCHANAECTRIGPNKGVCNCLRGFQGDGKSSCESINPCRVGNGGCSLYGKCNHTGPGTSTCTCNPSYVGDGYTCRGTVFQELSIHSETGGFFLQLQRNKMAELAGPGPFTVFVPTNAAFKRDKKLLEEVVARGQLSQLLWHHVVACNQLMMADLLALPALVSLHGEALTLARSPQVGGDAASVLVGGVAHITASDYVASNGVLHMLDRLLVPKRMQAFERTTSGLSSVLKNITAVAEDHGYSEFVSLLAKCGLLALVAEPLHRPYTMLWPTDAALRSLPPARRDFLYAPAQRDRLAEHLKFHMVRDAKVLASDMPTVGPLLTMQGSEISFSCSTSNATGELFVNEGSARIVQRALEFDGGLLYGLDALLQPPSVGGRCDVFTTIDIKGDCGNCARLPPCPGSTKSKDKIVRCSYSSLFGALRDGCRRDCALSVWHQQCCAGFYGRDCRPCPGGAARPCGRRGVCEDGSAGSGTCRCQAAFNGTACEECTPGRYGPSCKPCMCSATGTCDEGVAGSGSCFCAEGWTGKRCDTKLARKPVCVPACHKNAICRDNSTCICKPVYEGDGVSCKLVSLCKQANGGCHKWAGCYQKGTKVECRCRTGYEGDGRVCRWQDRCANDNNGGCSENAACTMTGPNKRRCTCGAGFVGNGEQCLPVAAPPIDRCLVDNGRCHPDATCTDLHHAEGVAGVSHVRSAKGQYLLNRTQAEEACASQGATIATFSQLSAAQQVGLHLCSVGWLAGGRAGYPTIYPSKRCGLGVVGVVDYGERLNQSELWDVYCFRVKEVRCACTDGFVGDGFSCNGDVLQVLAGLPGHATFYAALLAFANASDIGRELMEALGGGDDNITLFLPADSGFGANETLSWRDVSQHVVAPARGRVRYAAPPRASRCLTQRGGEECARPDQIPNGKWEGNVTIGSSITYSCDEHFRLEGESTLTCLETKEWSFLPPACDPFCGKPPPQRHAQLAIAYDRRELYRVDQYAYFYCDEYYRSPSPGFYLTCKQEGGRTTWDTDHRRCNREECERPDQIPNGKWEGNVTTGSSITYSCDEHFRLQGNRTLVCLYNHQWSSSPPACKPFCGKPPSQPHAKFSPVNDDKQQYFENQTVHFDCDEDYKSPSDGFDLYCRRKGDMMAWDADHKRCNREEGERPDKIPNGKWEGNVTTGSSITYSCDEQ
ncbi:stabilin-2-like [Lethenteron reissneri]|uniref:stabilin-2-like n=1 Tax=Lethenteron reissneri TaxID=7753 RepID=UPI002AB6DA31|nr:stabilin-2-like [Lethenteron reissneri]